MAPFVAAGSSSAAGEFSGSSCAGGAGGVGVSAFGWVFVGGWTAAGGGGGLESTDVDVAGGMSSASPSRPLRNEG